VRGAAFLGDVFWKTGDKRIIDGFGPDGVTAAARWGARRLSALHTGYLYHYAFVIIGALIFFGGLIFFTGQGS